MTVCTLLLLGLLTAPARAHEGHAPSPATVAGWWTYNPWVIAGLGLSAALFARGEWVLGRRAGRTRARTRLEVAGFAAGWLTIVLALLSPVDRLSDVLFSAHMFQHELLMLVAAPLLVLARPLQVYLWALSPSWRGWTLARVQSAPLQRGFAWLVNPWAALLLHGVVRWAWHLPVLFEAALESEWVHGVQHGSFFVTALAFWWAVAHGRYGRAGYGVSVLFVFVTVLHTGALGALIALADRTWYPLYEARTAAWALSPLADQQRAGLLMWVGGGLLLTAVGLSLFAAWLGEARRRAARAPLAAAVHARAPEGGA